jgi:hypothetical protein
MLEWITEQAELASAALASAATDARATATSGVLRVFRCAGENRERLAAAGRTRPRPLGQGNEITCDGSC